MKKIRVWDLPTRVFHWSLVCFVAAAIISQKIGGNAMDWHFRFGYAALTVVLFRIVWGLAGTRYARFSSFIYKPANIIAYAKGLNGNAKENYLGHNPLGSLSVFALLGVVMIQASTGLFSNDDIASEGPLVKFIGKDWSDRFSWFHSEVSADLVYILIGLHIAAIAYYYFRKKRNLVGPMVTGDKLAEIGAQPANDTLGMRLLALTIFAASAAAVYYIVHL